MAKIKPDPKIMAELLAEPEIAPKVAQMTPKELAYFKKLLVTRGTYARYVSERQNKEIKDIKDIIKDGTKAEKEK